MEDYTLLCHVSVTSGGLFGQPEMIYCPFLDNNLCIIYEVRPYSCVGYYVTTPLYKCHPEYFGEVKVKKHLPPLEIADIKFYYRELKKPLLVNMPKAVHEILTKEYVYLSTLPGLEGLEKEAKQNRI